LRSQQVFVVQTEVLYQVAGDFVDFECLLVFFVLVKSVSLFLELLRIHQLVVEVGFQVTQNYAVAFGQAVL